jgi:hypothetical protein
MRCVGASTLDAPYNPNLKRELKTEKSTCDNANLYILQSAFYMQWICEQTFFCLSNVKKPSIDKITNFGKLSKMDKIF